MARLPIRSLNDIPTFSWPDYVILALLLSVSAVIGIFYACTGGKQKTAGEFLLGDRKMQTLPVAMSLLAGFLSSVTILGIPAEVYLNGISYWYVCVSFCLVIPMVIYVYMPLFYNLRVVSVFEYLERRFSRPIRVYAFILFTLNMLIYMAVVLYGPAIALSAVTRIPDWACILIVGFICTFYTSIGGVKAVVWTDTLQLLLMFGGSITTLAVAMYHGGGVTEVVRLASQSGRFKDMYNFDPDPKVRHTFWSVIIGCFFFWTSVYGVNQSQVQRYLSIPTLRQAQLCLWIGLPGFLVLLTITSWTGLAMYAYYRHCDPLWQGLITAADQIVPLFTMETLGHFPGLPGLIIVGVFSGSLSTISSGMNALAANFLEDCWRLWKPDTSLEWQGRVSKIAAVTFGLLCIAFAFIVAQMGGVLEFAYALFGMISGPLLGLFAAGMFFPWTNSKGAAAGFTAGLVISLWIGIGSKLAGPLHVQPIRGRIYDSASCPAISGSYPVIRNVYLVNAEILDIYEMSYLWYGPLGCSTTVIIALLVSLATGRRHGKDIDPRLMVPFFAHLCFFLPKSTRKLLWFGVPYDKNESFIVHSRPNGNRNSRPTAPITASTATLAGPPSTPKTLPSRSRAPSVHTVNSHKGYLESDPGLIEYEIKVSVC